MRTETRLAFNRYLTRVAELNGVPEATVSFTAEPSVQQTLETRMQESSAFLTRINMFGVQELKGEKIGLSSGGTVAGRTAQADLPRQPRDIAALDTRGFECHKTDFDTFIPYARLDAWAKFPDFETRIRDMIIAQQARDRMMIGFNGVSEAATTNPTTNPLLQDVNKGWLQYLRETRPAGVLTEGATDGQLRIGYAAGNDYRNLDALVFDMVGTLIEPWFREDTGLVAVVGRELLHDKYFNLVNGEPTDKPTEQLAADVIMSTMRLGGLPAMRVPFFPPDAVMVTRLDNLSIYWQEGGRRRYVKEEPEYNRVSNYESSNDDYVIEEEGMAALAENIVTDW